ncbi:TRAP transporter substrate-binding protein [Paracoccus aerodenitrificans]|uniref:TRAP transporter substrate-binding protein n=1 Tax=Paracoccus aerodenitrificans TaxID=3017781 RepID=UPI0022F07F11|nr:TRAP transporter substrate-binding protein [Paracoccus aerodenitrificans]WBU63476.1 TRAP transporter substrate-binding protein [Paracoccus aerodenitrificans]
MFKSLAGIAFAVGTLSGAQLAAATEYRIGLITPPPHQWTVTANAIADELREATDGRIDLLIFPSGQLGNEAQMLQQLQTGALDFAFMTLGEFANRDPNYGIFLAPFIAEDVPAARKLLSGETAQELLDGVDKFGLEGFGYAMAGLRQIVMRDEVQSVSDLSGKKIRTVPLAPELDFWTGLGATPTPMPLPALYDAFANGQLDGMQIDFEGTWNSQYYEHAGSIIESNHMMFPMIAVGSARKWADIPPEDQSKISEVMQRHLDELIGKYAEIDAEYLEKLRGTDVPVKTVDRSFFGDSIDRWYEEWRTKTPLLQQLEAEAAHE